MGSQKRGEETRLLILEAAQASFAEKGYDGASVAEICARAGLSKGAFYHHFPTKQAVFSELLERWLTGIDLQLEMFRSGTLTVPDGLLRMAGAVRPVFESAGGQFQIFVEFLSQAVRDPEIWKTTIDPYRRYRALFEAMIQAGIAEGTIRRVDPQAASQAIVSLAVGLVLQGVLDPQGADWAKAAEEGVRMLLYGIATQDFSEGELK